MFLVTVAVSGVVLLWGVALTLFDLLLVYIHDNSEFTKKALPITATATVFSSKCKITEKFQ